MFVCSRASAISYDLFALSLYEEIEINIYRDDDNRNRQFYSLYLCLIIDILKK